MDDPNEKTINTLAETIAREKANLNARVKHLREKQDADTQDGARRKPGRLYEVFQAIND